MVKRRLGSALRARSYWSRCREIILRVITYYDSWFSTVQYKLIFTDADRHRRDRHRRGGPDRSGVPGEPFGRQGGFRPDADDHRAPVVAEPAGMLSEPAAFIGVEPGHFRYHRHDNSISPAAEQPVNLAFERGLVDRFIIMARGLKHRQHAGQGLTATHENRPLSISF